MQTESKYLGRFIAGRTKAGRLSLATSDHNKPSVEGEPLSWAGKLGGRGGTEGSVQGVGGSAGSWGGCM